jgi:hypothetical protein
MRFDSPANLGGDSSASFVLPGAPILDVYETSEAAIGFGKPCTRETA